MLSVCQSVGLVVCQGWEADGASGGAGGGKRGGDAAPVGALRAAGQDRGRRRRGRHRPPPDGGAKRQSRRGPRPAAELPARRYITATHCKLDGATETEAG